MDKKTSYNVLLIIGLYFGVALIGLQIFRLGYANGKALALSVPYQPNIFAMILLGIAILALIIFLVSFALLTRTKQEDKSSIVELVWYISCYILVFSSLLSNFFGS